MLHFLVQNSFDILISGSGPGDGSTNKLSGPSGVDGSSPAVAIPGPKSRPSDITPPNKTLSDKDHSSHHFIQFTLSPESPGQPRFHMDRVRKLEAEDAVVPPPAERAWYMRQGALRPKQCPVDPLSGKP